MKNTLLGLAYLFVGIGLFYSLLTDSIELFSVILIAILGLLFLSLFIIVRREGLVTTENKVIGVFVLMAMVNLFGLYEFTDFSSEIIFSIVFVVGVMIPHVLIHYTSYGSSKK